MKVESQVPPFGEIDVPDVEMVRVRLVLTDGWTMDVEVASEHDVNRWMASKIVSYQVGSKRFFHPMSAIQTIAIIDD